VEGLVNVVEKELLSSGAALPVPPDAPGEDALQSANAGSDEPDGNVPGGVPCAPTDVADLSDDEVTSLLSSMLSEEENQDE